MYAIRSYYERLKTEGVFEMNKELELPLVPQHIAVISSATAAGYQDFTEQLHNNEHGFLFHVKLFEAVMQGVETVITSYSIHYTKLYEM